MTYPDTRFRADFPDGTVVFLIGMRFNRLRAVRSWFPVFTAMPRMLRELHRHPELGLLEASTWWAGRNLMTVQYWRSMDDLMRYATGRDAAHFPAWQRFRREAQQTGHVGIWHEAYEVDPGRSHLLYGQMPAFGMGKATAWRPVAEMPPQPVRRHPVGNVLERPS